METKTCPSPHTNQAKQKLYKPNYKKTNKMCTKKENYFILIVKYTTGTALLITAYE